MSKQFQDRAVIVTGAARGIGEATARLFAERGAVVGIADLQGDAVERVVGEIEAAGGAAEGLVIDITDRGAVESAFDSFAGRHGNVDVLVNNAGIIRDNLIHKMSDDDWDAVLTTNLRGAWLCSQVAQRWMVKAERGSIINISSRSALGNRGQSNYSAAKAGMQGLTKTLAIELGRFGVRCNAIAPGHIETAMTRATAERIGLDYEQRKREVIERNAVKRVGCAEDIAYAAAWLSSEEAGYITGQVLYITGNPNT